MVLVKRLGYDSKHNSWIPESDIQHIEWYIQMAEGRFDDFEMQDLGENYTDYDMSLDELDQKDDFFNKRKSIILSEFSNYNYSNKTELADIQNRRRYMDLIRMRKFNQMETSLTENDDGKTVTKKSGVQFKTSGVEFVRVNNNYEGVEQENFDLAFKQQEEIEARLKNLSDLNREIAVNQIKRTQIINTKIKNYIKNL